VKVAFTATRYPRPEDRRKIMNLVMDLPAGTMVIVGAAKGGDVLIACLAFSAGLTVHTVVPANRSQVGDWRRWTHTYEEMPEGTDYRARNQRMVDLADEVWAVPQFKEDSPRSTRSGTWMTVRLARRAGKLGRVLILDEEL
jgi:hypothetical protein